MAVSALGILREQNKQKKEKKPKKKKKGLLQKADELTTKVFGGINEVTINPLGRALLRPFVSTYKDAKSLLTAGGLKANKDLESVNTPFGEVKPYGALTTKESLGEAGYLSTIALGMKPVASTAGNASTNMQYILQRTPYLNKAVTAIEKLPIIGGAGEIATTLLGGSYGASLEMLQDKSNKEVLNGAIYGGLLALGGYKLFQGIAGGASKYSDWSSSRKIKAKTTKVPTQETTGGTSNAGGYINRAKKEIKGSIYGKDPELMENISAGKEIARKAVLGNENQVAYEHAGNVYKDLKVAQQVKIKAYGQELKRLEQSGVLQQTPAKSTEMLNKEMNGILKNYKSKMVQDELMDVIEEINKADLGTENGLNELRKVLSDYSGASSKSNSFYGAVNKLNGYIRNNMSKELNQLNAEYSSKYLVDKMLGKFTNKKGQFNATKSKNFLKLVVRQKRLDNIDDLSAIGKIIGKDLVTDTKALFSLVDILGSYSGQGIKGMIQNMLKKSGAYANILGK